MSGSPAVAAPILAGHTTPTATRDEPARCIECHRPTHPDLAFCRACDEKITRKLVLWARGYKTAHPKAA